MSVCDPIAGSGELALRRHGMNGDHLLRMAYGVATAHCHKTGANIGDRIDDLAQHLALTATRRALNYKPELNPNSSFASYLWDIMEPACVDWWRRKGDGNGDRRYGHDNRVDLAGEAILELAAQDGEPPAEDDEKSPDRIWRDGAEDLQRPPVEWKTVHERRCIDWLEAAVIARWKFIEFVAVACDRYAKEIKAEEERKEAA